MRILAADIRLPPACRDLAAAVEEDLRAFLRRGRGDAEEAAPGVGELFEELERVIEAGGKRLRPVFCLLGHRAAGGETGPEAVRAAAALELLHTFAIVHDDVMDTSRTRRGKPASWVHLADRHRDEETPGDPAWFGVSGAILAGDLALMLADQALLGSGFPPERLLPAIRWYNRMRTGVVAGQYLDVVAARRGAAGEEEARRIARLKSGGYTVEGPLQIGALLAGGGADLALALERYGRPLGEAFQLRDDVLGVFGDPDRTGKSRDSDLREGKRTVLVAKALAAADAEGRRLLTERLGRPDLSDDEVERIRRVLEETGAVEAAQALIEDLASEARAAAEAAAIPEGVRGLLNELVETCTLRSS